MTSLPSGWNRFELDDVVEIHDYKRVPLNAKERSARRGPYPYYGANGQVDSIDDFLFDGEFILVAEDGGYFDDPTRAVAYKVDGRFWVNNHAHVLRPKAGFDLGFVLHQLNTVKWMDFVSGTTRPKLTQAALRRIELVAPSFDEQLRISARIDEILELSRRARRALTTVQTDGDLLLTSLYDEAYTVALEESTGVVSFESVLEDIRGGTTLVPNDRESEVSVLRSSAVRPRMVDLRDIRYLSGADDLSCHHLVREGDLLITRLSGSLEYVGNMAVVEGLGDKRIAYPDRLFRARLQPSQVGEFYAILFASPSIRKQLEPSAKSSAGHQRISISNVKELKVPLCDQATQDRIATRTQKQLRELTSIMEITTLALQSLNTLERGILADAFSGPR